jgi:hypothetical protein
VKESQNYLSEENDSWVSVSGKKMSYVDAVKKPVPMLTGANVVSIVNQKIWRPRISFFNHLGEAASNSHAITRKSVFDHLQGYLDRGFPMKNMGNQQVRNFQKSVNFVDHNHFNGFKDFKAPVMLAGPHLSRADRNPSQILKEGPVKAPNATNSFCVRCLRVGH